MAARDDVVLTRRATNAGNRSTAQKRAVSVPSMLRQIGLTAVRRCRAGHLQCLQSESFSCQTDLHKRQMSGSQAETNSKQNHDSERKATINRLLYRSKQRGFLEMDLLLGLWAQDNIHSASSPMLKAFEELLDLENPDLFKWITEQEAAPPDLQSNLAFKAVQESVREQLGRTVTRRAKTEPGKEWLRGWDDWKREAKAETH